MWAEPVLFCYFFYFCTKRWKYDTNDFPGFGRRAQKIFTLKYTFIRQGNITVSNSEIMSKLLEEYIAAHKDEIVEIPDAVYKNYVEKGRRTVKKRMATIERKRRDLK